MIYKREKTSWKAQRKMFGCSGQGCYNAENEEVRQRIEMPGGGG